MQIKTGEPRQVDGANVAMIVGGTPLVDASGLSPNPRVRIVVKLEGQNPWGSLKDRVAAALIRDARSTGRMRPATRLVVPSSGNTGIAYSRPEPGWQGTIVAARRMTASSNAALLDQYGSDANPAAHRDTTAREILLAVPDVTHFVGVFGTGGYLLGVGQRFLMEAARIRTLAAEPQVRKAA